jgi:Putative quorum-sensing-regulated virulence factor
MYRGLAALTSAGMRIAGRTGIQVGVFTSTDEKLLCLALDPAARSGEISSTAVKLIESFRRRGVKAEQIIVGSELAEKTPLQRAEAVRLNFGKYKGKAIAEVPADYLRWVLENVSNLSPAQRSAIRLILAAGGTE